MKTPRQLVRTCARRRCVVPLALVAAAAYLLSSEHSGGSGQPVAAPATGDALRHAHSGREDVRTLAKPRNDEERQALAQHVASMAAAGAMADAAVERINAPSTPAVPAAVTQPAAPHTRPAATLTSTDKHVEHENGHPGSTKHGDVAVRPTLPPPVAGAAGLPTSASATAVSGAKPGPSSSARVATFYYPWYGTPAVDGKWAHWDHPQIEHWDTKQRARFPHGENTRRAPPESIGSNFYPESGPYSSRDPAVVATHMRQIRQAGIGVVVVSWYPPGTQDVVQGGKEITVEDGILMPLVRRCHKHQLPGLKPAHSLQASLMSLNIQFKLLARR